MLSSSKVVRNRLNCTSKLYEARPDTSSLHCRPQEEEESFVKKGIPQQADYFFIFFNTNIIPSVFSTYYGIRDSK